MAKQHWHQIRLENVWPWDQGGDEEAKFDYMLEYFELVEDKRSNDELYNVSFIQSHLKKLAGLRRADVPSLFGWRASHRPARLPLSKGHDGEEYQIALDGDSWLPPIYCPSALKYEDDLKRSGDPLCRLMSIAKLPHPFQPGRETQPVSTTPAIASVVIPMGRLWVRNNLRYPDFFNDDEPVTDVTDYAVVADAGSEDMPVWILTSQLQLRERAADEGGYDFPAFLIFKGLMADEDHFYDAACRMSSIHQPDTREGDLGAATSAQACELVQKTRRFIDPFTKSVEKSMLDELCASDTGDFVPPQLIRSRSVSSMGAGKSSKRTPPPLSLDRIFLNSAPQLIIACKWRVIGFK